MGTSPTVRRSGPPRTIWICAFTRLPATGWRWTSTIPTECNWTPSTGSSPSPSGPRPSGAEVGSGSFTANDLPAETASLNVTAGSGDVSLYGSSFAGITASASSGTVFTGDLTVGEGLIVKVSSGSISLSETRARRVELNASSGDIWLGGMDAEEELAIRTSSGEVSLSQAQAGQLQIRTTSGDVWAETIRSAGSIAVSSTSGGVSLTVPESPELQIESTSGDVWCVLPGRHEDYAVTASTGSGRVSGVHSDHGEGAKTVTVTTTSGDISLDYAG